jgi:hypothetical protein
MAALCGKSDRNFKVIFLPTIPQNLPQKSRIATCVFSGRPKRNSPPALFYTGNERKQRANKANPRNAMASRTIGCEAVAGRFLGYG